MITPILPSIGAVVQLFGITAEVTAIEPQDDWHWRIELKSTNGLDANEEWEVVIPTDFRTEDGFPVTGEPTDGYQPPVGPFPFSIRDDCGICGEDATLDDYAEFIADDGNHIMAHSSCAADLDYTQA